LAADGSVDLWPMWLRSAAEGGRPRRSAGGANAIVLFDSQGNELLRHGFDTTPVSNHGRISRSTFDEDVPWHPDTQRISLTRHGVVVAERSVSAAAPTVHVISPNGGERWPAEGDITVRWEAADSDADALSFTVDYSADAGRTWEGIASNVKRTSYTLHAWEVPASGEALVRVRASDGIRTSGDVSDAPFETATKPPVLGILGIADQTTVPAGRPLTLRGIGVDPDGGMLRGMALEWTSDRDGHLGSGEILSVTHLSPGPHSITLRGTDRHGEQSSTHVQVIVAG
jgi:hypothetical protein